MFIPYQNGHMKRQDFLDVVSMSPNMSGNFGRGPNDLGAQLYNQLSSDAQLDPLWNQDQDLNEDATKIIHGGRCMHCKHWVGGKGADMVQIQHVLNGCKSFKTQRRYHWRHEAVLDYIGTLLEKDPDDDGNAWTAFRCYIDVPGRRTHDDGTVPDQLLVTSAKPDIFILDQRDHLPR